MSVKIINTDVMVIGGGLAGCFAAVRARELNTEVVLVEKNYTGKSGCSHYARDMMVFNEDWGDDFNAWMQQFSRIGEYITDQRWNEIIIKESYPRYLDLISWGEPFLLKNETVGFPKPDEEPWRIIPRKTKIRFTTSITKFGARHKMSIARKKVIDSGCTILDRIMITDLVKHDGRIVGAVGFHTRNGDFYLIKSRATVIANGGLSFRSATYGIQFNTGDGIMMGFRAGAELTGMEFGSGMYVVKDCDSVVIDGPVAEIGKKRDMVTNAYGEEFLKGFPQVPTNILWALEFHKGNGPIYHEPYGMDRERFKSEIKKYEETAEGPWITMLDRAGLDVFKQKFEQYMAFEGSFFPGGLRVNTNCETNIPGLYAAGDASGTNFTGPTYAVLGSGMAGASITGYRAGQNAAEFTKEVSETEISESEIAKYREIMFTPINRIGGFSTNHVLSRIQQIILPYEIRIVMHKKRLQSALTMIEFFRDHFAPKLKAVDPHDLRKAHEIRNMILGAEVMIMSALFRTESRGWFYREDYPQRDDENWLKWILLNYKDEKINIRTEPVPTEFQGDRLLSYEKRYPLHYEEI